MPRNFQRRVEILFPVEDERLHHRIVEGILGVTLMDNVKARAMCHDGTYVRLTPDPGAPALRSQVEFQNMARELSLENRIASELASHPVRKVPWMQGRF